MRQYRTFILALLLIGTLFSSLHFHEDGHVDEDCQVCILEHNFMGADLERSTSLEKVQLYFDVPSYTSLLLTQTNYKDADSRAPPSFS